MNLEVLLIIGGIVATIWVMQRWRTKHEAQRSELTRWAHELDPSDDDKDGDDNKRSFLLGVRGESFNNSDGSSRQKIIEGCVEGDAILLKPEPTNPHDHLAVKVCTQWGKQIGYLPEGHGLTRKIEDGRVSAAIEAINSGEKGLYGVVLRIDVHVN